MKSTIYKYLLIIFLLINCNNEKYNKNSTVNTNKSISISEAKSLAEKKFNSYLPKILKSNNAILDGSSTYVGDFTGDGIDDIVICFALAPAVGGNMLSGLGMVLYKNDGKDVTVIAGFEPDYLFSFDRIENGNIYIKKLDYAEDDPRCCPSIEEDYKLTISGKNVY
jgi:hypothetical protein